MRKVLFLTLIFLCGCNYTTTLNVETIPSSIQIPCVIDFSATYCGWCKKYKPVFDVVSEQMKDKDIHFYYMNTSESDQAYNLSETFDISSIPATIFIDKNKIVHKVVGYMGEGTLKSNIKDYIR